MDSADTPPLIMSRKMPSKARESLVPGRGVFELDAALFRSLAENIGDVLWFRELEPLRFLYVSPAFEQISGIRMAELQANPQLWDEAVHPEDRMQVKSALQRWISGKTQDYEVQYRLISRDGKVRWLADRGFILGRKDGRPYQIGGIAREITQSKADEAVRSRLAAVVESSDDAIITMDLKSVIQTWNDSAERIFGYTAAEAVGRSVAFLRPAEAADDEAVFQKHIRKGQRIRHYETLRRRKDGRIIEISLSISPLMDAFGKLIGFSKISRDITERNAAKRNFASLLEAAPDGFIIMDGAGVIQLANARAEHLFGYTRRQMLGSSFEKLLPAREHKRHAALRKDFLSRPEIQETFRGLEMQGLHKEGREFPMELNLSQIETPDGSLIITDICDITDRKQAEQTIRTLNAELEMRVEQRTAELSQANEELRALVEISNRLREEILRISEHEQRRIGQDLHDDLGQQLAGTWMMSNVLERQLAARSAPEHADARNISSHLQTALAKTRGLARGLHPVAPEQGGFAMAIKELAARSSVLFDMNCRFEMRVPIHIANQTVATHLYRIAQEAVSNAAKHGRAKKVRVRLSSKQGIGSLSIHDDGAGLKTVGDESQGLGLRIMRYRADMIGGSLTLANGAKKGTIVTCTFTLNSDSTSHA